jgi:hypothetical protein
MRKSPDAVGVITGVTGVAGVKVGPSVGVFVAGGIRLGVAVTTVGVGAGVFV